MPVIEVAGTPSLEYWILSVDMLLSVSSGSEPDVDHAESSKISWSNCKYKHHIHNMEMDLYLLADPTRLSSW